MSRRLLLVRPEPGLGASMRRAAALSIEATAIPLFEVVAVPWDAPEPERFDALLLTSASTIRLGGAALQRFAHLPVHAVGAATAETARDAGFRVASVGDAGAAQLLATLPPTMRLFHPGGRHRTVADAVQPIVEAQVYEARAIESAVLPDLAGWVVAIHSTRAGQRVAELIAERGEVRIGAISETAAAACGTGWADIQIADQPSDERLLALAAKLCQTDRE